MLNWDDFNETETKVKKPEVSKEIEKKVVESIKRKYNPNSPTPTKGKIRGR